MENEIVKGCHNTGKFVVTGSVQPSGINVTATATFDENDSAVEISNRIPKSCKARVFPRYGMDVPVVWVVEIKASLSSSKVSGTENESGAKRLRIALGKVEYVCAMSAFQNAATAEQVESSVFGA